MEMRTGKRDPTVTEQVSIPEFGSISVSNVDDNEQANRDAEVLKIEKLEAPVVVEIENGTR